MANYIRITRRVVSSPRAKLSRNSPLRTGVTVAPVFRDPSTPVDTDRKRNASIRLFLIGWGDRKTTSNIADTQANFSESKRNAELLSCRPAQRGSSLERWKKSVRVISLGPTRITNNRVKYIRSLVLTFNGVSKAVNPQLVKALQDQLVYIYIYLSYLKLIKHFLMGKVENRLIHCLMHCFSAANVSSCVFR